MTSQVEVVEADRPVSEAAEMMRSLDVGSLPVVDSKGGGLVGMVTDRDLTIHALAEGWDPNTSPVRNCMSRDVHACFEDQDTSEAETLMQEKQIRRVLILDRDRRLTGIVSLADIVTKTAETDEIDRTMWKISQPNGK